MKKDIESSLQFNHVFEDHVLSPSITISLLKSKTFGLKCIGVLGKAARSHNTY